MRSIKISVVSVIFIFCTALLWAVSIIYVNDIKINPSSYENTIVEIEGYVTALKPGINSYEITDDLNGHIDVYTEHKFPDFGKYLTIRGLVSKDKNSTIYLRELKRSTDQYFILKVAMIVSIVILALVLLTIFIRRIISVKGARGKVSNETIPVLNINARLVIEEGPADLGKRYEIRTAKSVIGIGGDIKLSEAHEKVSKNHAILLYSNGEFTIEPTKEAITGVNGKIISDRCKLESGDVIDLEGTKLRLYVDMGDFVPLNNKDASFTIIGGPGDLEKLYKITKKESTIGREGDIKMSDKHKTVSRIHARLIYTEGRFILKNESKRNITKVNGVDESDEHELKSGDMIELGQTQLRFDCKTRQPYLAKLTIITAPGEDAGNTYFIKQEESRIVVQTNKGGVTTPQSISAIVIGQNGDIKLSDRKVDSKHVILRYLDGDFVLENTTVTCITKVNNEDITISDNRKLKSGDELQLGETSLKFQIPL